MIAPSTHPSAPGRVLQVLYRSLRGALAAHGTRTNEAHIVLWRENDPGADETVLPLRMSVRGRARLSARLTARPLGDGTYDVRCTVQDGPSRRFTFSQPGEGGVRLSHAPVLGQTLARFLLDELKKHLGERLLRSPSGRSGPPVRRSTVP